MKTIQFTGPFSYGQTMSGEVELDVTYVHVGINVPYRDELDKDSAPDLKIGDVLYRIPNTGILEYDGIEVSSLPITVLKDLPFGSVIDIAYDTA